MSYSEVGIVQCHHGFPHIWAFPPLLRKQTQNGAASEGALTTSQGPSTTCLFHKVYLILWQNVTVVRVSQPMIWIVEGALLTQSRWLSWAQSQGWRTLLSFSGLSRKQILLNWQIHGLWKQEDLNAGSSYIQQMVQNITFPECDFPGSLSITTVMPSTLVSSTKVQWLHVLLTQ